MKKTKLVVLTGAGISAESGLKTFRDNGGLWEGYNIYDVATPEAWHRNPQMVLEFYNMRRKGVLAAEPNAAHLLLAKLEDEMDVWIITQNVDNLHERAGSSRVLHLHGEITRAQSTADPDLIYAIKGGELNLGDRCAMGSQLRPFIVWFGEQVPMMDEALEWVREADIFAVIGTSLQVYPAAGLVHHVPHKTPVYLIDPGNPDVRPRENLHIICEPAGSGVEKLIQRLLP